MPNAVTDKPTRNPIRERWGRALDEGFVIVPVALLRHQHALGIDAGELVVLVNLLANWWSDGRSPYPSTHRLAQRMGVSSRTVQRHLERLEDRGLIHRQRNQPADSATDIRLTRYDLTGLVDKLRALGAGGYFPGNATPPEEPGGQHEAQAA